MALVRILTYTILLVGFACSKSESPPQKGGVHRIVTLTPSATDLVVALGDVHKIVGRDKYSTEPPAMKEIPVVGDFVAPNVELIAALAPDLVVLDDAQDKTIASLGALGLRSLAVEMHDLEDLTQGLETVGAAIGRVQEAKQAQERINGILQQAADRGAKRGESPLVLILVDRDPEQLRNLIAAGPGSYLGELLVVIGARNVMDGAVTRYPKLALEHILRSKPDIIIDVSQSSGGASGLERWSELAELEVYRKARIHTLQDPRLTAPSTEVDGAIELLLNATSMDSSL